MKAKTEKNLCLPLGENLNTQEVKRLIDNFNKNHKFLNGETYENIF